MRSAQSGFGGSGGFAGPIASGGLADPTAFVRSICNYPGQRTKLHDFFLGFEIDDPNASTNPPSVPLGAGKGKRGKKSAVVPKVKKYMAMIERLSGKDPAKVLEVDSDDILQHFKSTNEEKSMDILNTLLCNAPRAIRLLYETVEDIKNEHFPANENTAQDLKNKVRLLVNKSLDLPVSHRADFEIHLLPPKKAAPVAINKLRANHIGSLITIEGTVSKITSVKPQLLVGVYRCDDCGAYQFQHVESYSFRPLTDCQSSACRSARRNDTLQLCLRDSKFVKRQEARVQELSHAVPPGAVPRQLKVILRGELTRVLRPGMSVSLGGVLVPENQDRGYGLRATLTGGQTVLEAHWLCPNAIKSSEASQEENEKEIEFLCKQSSAEDLYNRMAASIAPTIHGFDDVKKVLLLQLVGGTSTNEGIKLRGDIHVLLMGDPGIAKSQLLLRMCAVAPRAHYTCGKGASGVGLTASVMKDPLTGEFTLEGGAIVLADNGVCCVDEFDKLQESDRTAIHEVMEQQTVSISKAGLNATLNARTTILAAANPVMGRYDLTKNAVTNIGLPAALLSRFDVVFLLLDQGGVYSKDLSMARHLLKVHREKRIAQIEASDGEQYRPLSASVLRALIARAQTHSPKLSPELAADVCDHYVQMRANSKSSSVENFYITPRTLCGLLRLSQALARLRFSDEISSNDFTEALRLIKASTDSVSQQKDKQQSEGLEENRSQVLNFVRNNVKPLEWMDLEDATTKLASSGLLPGDVEETIENLVACGVIKWDGPRRRKFQLISNLESISEE